MDPNIQNIILGVAANGLTSLIAYLCQKGRDFIVGNEILEKMRREQTALQPILQQAADSVSQTMEWEGPGKLEEVCLFLLSPEVETIVRQIYSTKILEEEKSLDAIKKEFVISLALYVDIKESIIIEKAETIFHNLIDVCNNNLNNAIDDEILSAHEAKSSFRHRKILDEISAIQKLISILTAKQSSDIHNIIDFENKYREQVSQRHKFIVPPYYDSQKKVPIDSIYIAPSFFSISKQKDEEPDFFEMADVLSSIYRAVILGNPGGGKSTFAHKICYDLSTRYEERLYGGRKITPILVVLRDYGAEKKNQHLSILQFIELTANSKYQIEPPPGAFEYLFLNGRAIVIFDGLDELLDTHYRQEISADIESFCNLYPSVPALVTSRLVGYEQAPLDESQFESFVIADFDDDQVEEYVYKWFAAEEDLTSEQQKEKAKNYIEESEIVPDLRSNPLMLALMCNIYRGENYIPQNRPDVYEKCTTMLFERWDKGRGIHVSLPFEAIIKPAMMYLAHWIYANESLQGGVSERDLIMKATDYLCGRRFEDRDEAERAAREFIEFCRGRAWVFTDTGTTKTGEKLYQFTHRTFLEYFTASHLVRIYPTPDRLGKMLLPKIALREWDIVAQLAFQIQNKNVEGAGDELLMMLIDPINHETDKIKWNMVSFAGRCLEFLIPIPKVTRSITSASIDMLFDKILKQTRRNYEWQRLIREFIGNLLNAAIESHTFIGSVLENFLVPRIESGTEKEAILAGEIAMHLTELLNIRMRKTVIIDFWNQIVERIIGTCLKRLFVLAHSNLSICIDLFWHKRISISQLIEWHGIETIFIRAPYIFSRVGRQPIALVIAKSIIYPPSSEAIRNLLEQTVKDIGIILLSILPPWFKRTQGLVRIILRERPGLTPLNLDSDGLFGIFALFASMSEEREERIDYYVTIIRRHSPSLSLLLSARYKGIEAERVERAMDECGFSDEQKGLVGQWIKNETNFCAKRAKKRPIQKRFDIEEGGD